MKNNEIFQLMLNAREKFDNSEGHLLGLQFMYDCLTLILDGAPIIIKNAILTLEKYCLGEVTANELTAARVACWEFLDKESKNPNLKKRSSLTIEAVIVALYPEPPSGDLLESLEWFWGKFSKIGKFESIAIERLKYHFKLT